MKTFQIILFALFLSASLSLAQDPLYVYQSGAVLYKRVITAVDSVTFQKVNAPPTTVTDIDGNVYHTITIGTQVWMVENLKTTKYKDGTAIPYVTDDTAWTNLITPGYCWYNNDATTYKNTYGALYNWYAVNTAMLAPTGWHVPTADEWDELETYVRANLGTSGSVAKALAATINWAASTSAGAIGNDLTKNNSSGFSALPGGFRFSVNGPFYAVGSYGYWWSATGYSTSSAWYGYMYCSNSFMDRDGRDKQHGFSVRCVRDN